MPRIVLLACLLVLNTIGNSLHAEENSCQQCRDYNHVCLQNYSQATCKSEYELCMKHCRK